MIFKCKMCGGDIEMSSDKTLGTCEYCGSTMTLPRIDDDQRAAAFNRGNHFRRQGEFDKALAVYERIVAEDDTDAEAHWCCALCRFGIEYVEDPSTYEYVPTCHRASFDSILEDVDYLAALEHSDGITKRQYQKDAAKIAEVQRGILATSQREEPFDVFICYKETDDTTKERTRDSLDAQEIYYNLTQEGFRVFFSRITLEDKVGTEYEPYIFAALNSAKVMVVVGEKPEHFSAIWVKNEWSRFLNLMKKDRSKVLLPCYKEMDPYDLPEQLSVLQSYDMSKIGFMQDLIRGIKKIIRTDEVATPVTETVVLNSGANIAPLLKRAFMYLEEGKWQNADEYCERVLDQDPENAEAYLGKLMADLNVRRREDLENCAESFEGNNNYQRAVRFGNNELSDELKGYIEHIEQRNHYNDLKEKYGYALNGMKTAKTSQQYRDLAGLFIELKGFEDADQLQKQCLDRSVECWKNETYISATEKSRSGSIETINAAIVEFQSISGWKDADEQISACYKKIEEIKVKEEADRLEAQRKKEAKQNRKRKRKKVFKKAAIIIGAVIVVVASFIIIYLTLIVPNNKYNSAMDHLNNGEYDEAISMFTELAGYKDSEEQIKECKYNIALGYYNDGKYDDANKIFTELNGYKDSSEQLENCKLAINEMQYNNALQYMNKEQYPNAISIFSTITNYKDSADLLEECKEKQAEIEEKQKKSELIDKLNDMCSSFGLLVDPDGDDVYEDNGSILFFLENKSAFTRLSGSEITSLFSNSDWEARTNQEFDDAGLFGYWRYFNANGTWKEEYYDGAWKVEDDCLVCFDPGHEDSTLFTDKFEVYDLKNGYYCLYTYQDIYGRVMPEWMIRKK